MARNFVAASSQSLSNATPVVTGSPCSFSVWFNATSAVTAQGILSVGADTSANNRNNISLNGSGAGAKLSFTNADNAASVNASSTATYSANVWNHAGGVWTDATTHIVYLNGTSTTGATTSIGSMTGGNISIVGRRASGGTPNFFDGNIAEAAIWNVALSATDMAALAAGVCPLLIRPDALVFYSPLQGHGSPEPDFRGRLSLTLNATPVYAVHPRIYYADGPLIRTVSSAGGTTYNVTVTETGAAADTDLAAAVFASSAAETGAAADTDSAAALYVSSTAEVATGSDTNSSSCIFRPSCSEAGGAVDTVTCAAVFGASIAEVLTAVDTVSNGSVYNLTVGEVGAAVDTNSVAATFVSSAAETGAASDSNSTHLTAAVSIGEVTAASETSTTTGSFGVSCSEAGGALDTVTVLATFAVSVLELLTAIDTVTITATFVGRTIDIDGHDSTHKSLIGHDGTVIRIHGHDHTSIQLIGYNT